MEGSFVSLLIFALWFTYMNNEEELEYTQEIQH